MNNFLRQISIFVFVMVIVPMTAVQAQLTLSSTSNISMVACGDNVVISIKAESGFTDLLGVQFSVNWDPMRFQYISNAPVTITNGGDPVIGVLGVAAGSLTYSWIEDDDNVEDDMANGSVLLTITLKVISSLPDLDVSLSDNPTPGEAIDNTFANIGVIYSPAKASISVNSGPVKNENKTLFYCNIQDAIDDADDNDVITVSAGVYNITSTINVHKPVTINGPKANVDPRTAAALRTPGDASEAIVDGGGTVDTIFNITVPGVILNGLEVRSGAKDVIATAPGTPVKTGVTVKYCIVHGSTTDEGIQLRNVNGGGVEYCLVYDVKGDGINLCCGSTNSFIQHNEIYDSESSDAVIYLYDNGPSILVDNNLVYDNPAAIGIMVGVKDGTNFNSNSAFSNNAIISNNIVTGNGNTDTDNIGIYVNTSRVDVLNNIVSECGSTADASLYFKYNIKNINASGNVFANNYRGVKVSSGVNSTNALSFAINNNSFTNSTLHHIINSSSGTVNATCNWLGSTVLATNTAKISGPVTFVPWLSTGDDATLLVTGFQPDAICGTNVVIDDAVPTAQNCSALGEIEVAFSGGVAPYSISWTGGGPITNVMTSPETIPTLSAGSYTITVTSANGTTATTSATVLYLPVTNTSDMPNTHYATIQEAINALTTTAGETIVVCAGTYDEVVTVNKALTIKGANQGIAGNAGRGAESILDGNNGAHPGFVITSNDVTIDGFKVQNCGAGLYESGIYINTSGCTIKNNILFNNAKGLYPSNTGTTTVEYNLFDANNRPGPAGAVAIYAFTSNSLSVLNNEFKGQTSNSVAIFDDNLAAGPAHVNLIFNNNYLHDNHSTPLGSSAIYAADINGGEFGNNVITNGKRGIKVAGGNSNINIHNNAISGTVEADVMVDVDYGTNSQIEIHNNSLTSAVSILNNDNGTVPDATCNWYGTLTPASHITGTGSVNYCPWLTDGTDNDVTPSGFGFQPVPNSCNGTGGPGGVVTNTTTGNLYCSIQAAINAASPNDQITASAGTYTEQVNVTKPLTIKGAQFGQPCATRLGAESIVAGGAGTSFTISSTGVTIDGFDITGLTGIASTGFTDFTVRNNKIVADWIGINITGLNTAAAAGTIDKNCVDLTTQLNGVVNQPTVGVLLNGVNGANPMTVTDNKIKDGHYGYVLHNVNPTSVKQEISGGTITGVMQGVAVLNTLDGAAYFPSKVEVDNISMSAFFGDLTGIITPLPAGPFKTFLTGINFHAGIYSYTAGGTTNETIELDVNNGSISGTGKPSQSSGGIYIADFSSTGSVKQTVAINNTLILNNKNRGIDARGKVSVMVTNSTLDGNGYDAFATGGNDGFAMIAQQGATITATNNFITHPAASATTVTAFLTANGTGSTINATNNSVLMNGNPMGKGATNDAGHTINATCNWWGVSCAANVAALMSGVVTYNPFLGIGTEPLLEIPTIGFQPMPGSCTGAVIAAIAGVTTLCEPGLTSVLTGSATGGLAPYTTHLWSSATPANVSVGPTNAAITTATSVAQGSSILTYTVTDTNGCTDTETVTFTVTNPTVFPTYTIPAMGASIAGYTCGSTINKFTDPASCNSFQTIVEPIWADNCGVVSTTATANNMVAITDLGSFVSGNFPKGMTILSFTATDAAGNTTTCTIEIVVTDNVGPVFNSMPADIIVTAPYGDCSAIVSWLPPTASDNCPGTVTITSTHSPGSSFLVGTTTEVTYTANDGVNMSMVSFDVTVNGFCIPAVELTPVSNIPVMGETFINGQMKVIEFSVSNIGGNDSHELLPIGNVKVLVGYPSTAIFTTLFDPMATLDNDDWLVFNYGTGMSLFTLKPGKFILAGESKKITVKFTATGTKGQSGKTTARIYTGSGGDINSSNNYRDGALKIN